MKKYGFLFLLILPTIAFGASSVKMLGNTPAAVAAVESGAKITPAKVSSEKEVSASTGARIGSLSAKTKKLGTSSAGNANSSSRFPAIMPAHSYTGVVAPQTNQAHQSGGSVAPTPANVNVDEIIDAVKQDIAEDYYNKNEVYDNDEFRAAVRDSITVEDNPAVGALKVGEPDNAEDLPDGYVYVWVQ